MSLLTVGRVGLGVDSTHQRSLARSLGVIRMLSVLRLGRSILPWVVTSRQRSSYTWPNNACFREVVVNTHVQCSSRYRRTALAGRFVVRDTGLAAACKNTVFKRMFGQNRLAVDKTSAVWYHKWNKKLIRRWDSERELSLWRHRTCIHRRNFRGVRGVRVPPHFLKWGVPYPPLLSATKVAIFVCI